MYDINVSLYYLSTITTTSSNGNMIQNYTFTSQCMNQSRIESRITYVFELQYVSLKNYLLNPTSLR